MAGAAKTRTMSPRSSNNPASAGRTRPVEVSPAASRGRTILLFTRAPEAEARAKGLPVEDGARLFAAFLQGWRKLSAGAGAELRVVAPAASVRPLERLLPGVPVTQQRGPSFAARLESAFSDAFRQGAGAVLMVGGDGPPLELNAVRQAFSHLEAQDQALALVPAEDGGVSAIGFNRRAKRPLAGLRWLSSDVCRQLEAAAADCGLALLVTSIAQDLDRPRDVAALYRRSLADPSWRPFRRLLRCLLRGNRPAPAAEPKIAVRTTIDSRVTRGPPPAFLLLQA